MQYGTDQKRGLTLPQGEAQQDQAGTFERVLKRDRFLVVSGLSVVAAVAWTYILFGAGMDMPREVISASASWSVSYAFLMFGMWWVMMVAMMLPSAAPMILLFASASRNNAATTGPGLSIFVLASGYLLVWGLFSVAAVGVQWYLTSVRLLSPMMESSSVVLGGVLVLVVGIYQLTPLKDACLRYCRSPIHMVMSGWRPGTLGAFRMGCEHGVFCLGCCWALMLLLFYGGVMNLAWIGGIALYVMIEKFAPMGTMIGRFSGVILMVWGAVILWISVPLATG